MNIKRKVLVDRMANLYGVENGLVKFFTKLCEDTENNTTNDTLLQILVERHEENPVK